MAQREAHDGNLSNLLGTRLCRSLDVGIVVVAAVLNDVDPVAESIFA